MNSRLFQTRSVQAFILAVVHTATFQQALASPGSLEKASRQDCSGSLDENGFDDPSCAAPLSQELPEVDDSDYDFNFDFVDSDPVGDAIDSIDDELDDFAGTNACEEALQACDEEATADFNECVDDGFGFWSCFVESNAVLEWCVEVAHGPVGPCDANVVDE